MMVLRERDPYSPVRYEYAVDSILYNGRSKFQEIQIVTNPFFGRMLVLDGVVQCTERDEYMYHEMLTHPAMHAHPNPRKVVVIGGGDGGIVREVLRHKSVEQVHLIEIDAEVIEVSRRFLPTISSALSDPRVVINPMDGAVFLEKIDFRPDVIIVDSTDIVGNAQPLFKPEFFANAKRCLTDNGLYVTHTESLHFHLPLLKQVHGNMARAFPLIRIYSAPIATYAGNWWAFLVATKGADPSKPVRHDEFETVYYGKEIHEKAFLPDKLSRRLVAGEMPMPPAR